MKYHIITYDSLGINTILYKYDSPFYRFQNKYHAFNNDIFAILIEQLLFNKWKRDGAYRKRDNKHVTISSRFVKCEINPCLFLGGLTTSLAGQYLYYLGLNANANSRNHFNYNSCGPKNFSLGFGQVGNIIDR